MGLLERSSVCCPWHGRRLQLLIVQRLSNVLLLTRDLLDTVWNLWLLGEILLL